MSNKDLNEPIDVDVLNGCFSPHLSIHVVILIWPMTTKMMIVVLVVDDLDLNCSHFHVPMYYHNHFSLSNLQHWLMMSMMMSTRELLLCDSQLEERERNEQLNEHDAVLEQSIHWLSIDLIFEKEEEKKRTKMILFDYCSLCSMQLVEETSDW